jgi:hypothetical protein
MLVLESGDDEQPGDHADMTAEEGGNTSRNSKHAVNFDLNSRKLVLSPIVVPSTRRPWFSGESECGGYHDENMEHEQC